MEEDGKITSTVLLDFMKDFKQSMEVKSNRLEEKIEETNEKIEGKFKKLDDEMEKMNARMDKGERKQEESDKRMEDRFKKLEIEMEKSAEIKKKIDKLTEREIEMIEKPEERIRGNNKIWTPIRGRIEGQGEDERRKEEQKRKRLQREELDKGEQMMSPFRSTWAKTMQRELEDAAAEAEEPKKIRSSKEKEKDPEKEKEKVEEREVPEQWDDWEEWREVEEIRKPARGMERPRTKIRKPVIIKSWFGEDSSSSEDFESGSEGEWSEVERKKKGEEKRRRAKRKREMKKKECAMRAKNMVGVGPILQEAIENRMDEGASFEGAKILAVKDFLFDNLGYNKEELDKLDIVETKIASKGENVINIAMTEHDDIKELFMRKAESQNDDVIIRNYIPPNFYERYMYLNKICSEKRKEDKMMKTQLRFGSKDSAFLTIFPCLELCEVLGHFFR